MGDPCAKYPCGRAHHGRGRRRLSPTSRPLTVGAEEASFGRHPRRRHRPCHHLGRSRRRCRALRRVGRPFRPSAPSVKKHERVTAVSGPTVDLEGHFWCYGPYITMKKITCGRLKLVLTFPSLSLSLSLSLSHESRGRQSPPAARDPAGLRRPLTLKIFMSCLWQ